MDNVVDKNLRMLQRSLNITLELLPLYLPTI